MTIDRRPPESETDTHNGATLRTAPGGTESLHPPGPIARVPRSKRAARDWYDAVSGWYDVVADPFEAPTRNAALELLDASPGERILDVGCGTGTALSKIVRSVGPEGAAVGIDLAEGMCHRAWHALETAGNGPGVVVGDAAALPFDDDSFDALFASFVLELFDTPTIPTVLREWRRVLAPDGRLCVVALSRRHGGPIPALYERIHDRFPTIVDCRPIHVRETLREAGLRLVATRDERMCGLPVAIVCGTFDY